MSHPIVTVQVVPPPAPPRVALLIGSLVGASWNVARELAGLFAQASVDRAPHTQESRHA